MEVLEIDLGDRSPVEVGSVGTRGARPVLYFHSPATAGEELADAHPAARAQGLELLTIRRPSVRCDDPTRFVEQVAEMAGTVVAKLGLDALSVLGWSGGAPYALAAAARVAAPSVQLVSPVPGPLTGPNAIADQSSRLREVATSTLESPWISGPAALRDYLAVASSWPIEPASVEAEVTVWAPDADEIVPPGVLRCLADALPEGELLNVRGDHGWLTQNWSTVLEHC